MQLKLPFLWCFCIHLHLCPAKHGTRICKLLSFAERGQDSAVDLPWQKLTLARYLQAATRFILRFVFSHRTAQFSKKDKDEGHIYAPECLPVLCHFHWPQPVRQSLQGGFSLSAFQQIRQLIYAPCEWIVQGWGLVLWMAHATVASNPWCSSLSPSLPKEAGWGSWGIACN